MDDLVERWPGYNDQSWAERFAELDRRFSKERDTAVKVVCQLSEQKSARIQALETSLAEAEGRVKALTIALHDAIRRPMGVVPESAEPFYQPALALAQACLKARENADG